MKRPKSLNFLFFAFVTICFLYTSCAKEDPEIKNLLDKNIEAAGGMEKISQVENYSFKIGNQTVYLSSEGEMKIVSGTEPVITDVILASSRGAKRNCFNQISEYEGFEKAEIQSLAKIRSALFTLENYKGQLELHGLKQFGPKNYHMLTSKEGDLDVEFYIDSEDFLLKRLVFSGFSDETGKYEVNHDFVSFQEVDGVKIPESWFASQVGTRGSLQQATDVAFNQELAGNFFSDHEINAGEVEIGEGLLNGNVIDFNLMRGNRLMIGTNFTQSCFLNAGFNSGDKLILEIADTEMEVDYYDSQPPRSAYSGDSVLMIPNRRSENFVVYILSPDYSEMAERLEPLMSIDVKKKQ
jgi:hypothetical protein